MKRGGMGGGNTITGINFEGRANFLSLLENLPNYEVKESEVGHKIFYKKELVANSYKKNELYKYLDSRGVDWEEHITKKLLPDDAIYVIRNNILYILEMKYQEVEGSVDEKLQTCDFKKKQYSKLLAPLNIEVEYIYILSEWFKKPRYKDVLNYVISVGCHYYFNYLPLHKIGLPVP